MQQASEQQMSLLFVLLFARPTCSHEGYCEPKDWSVGPHHGCSLFDPADQDFAVSLAENNWDCVASSSLLKSRHETTNQLFPSNSYALEQSLNLSISISFARSLTRRTFFPLRLVSTPKLSRRFARSCNGPCVEVGRWRWKELQLCCQLMCLEDFFFFPNLITIN